MCSLFMLSKSWIFLSWVSCLPLSLIKTYQAAHSNSRVEADWLPTCWRAYFFPIALLEDLWHLLCRISTFFSLNGASSCGRLWRGFTSNWGISTTDQQGDRYTPHTAWCLWSGVKNIAITWYECSEVFLIQMGPTPEHVSLNFSKLKGGWSQSA